MSIVSHLSTLQQKHDNIQKEIESGYVHHMSDDEISRLKKEKLRIKDTIYRQRKPEAA